MSEDQKVKISGSTFHRSNHAKNYTVIINTLARDQSITFECRGFLLYLLSFYGDWVISMPYIMKEQKISRDRLYRLINQAMEAGYLKRVITKQGNLNRIRYEVAEEPIFKKCFRHTDFQEAEGQHAGGTDTIKEELTNPSSSLRSEEVKKKKKERASDSPPKASPPPPPEPVGSDLSFLLYESIKKIKENFNKPNMAEWSKEMLEMVDAGYSPSRIKTVLAHLHKLPFWSTVALSPSSFKKCFERAELASWIVINNETVDSFLDRFPPLQKILKFSNNFIVHSETYKEIDLRMEPDSFLKVFKDVFKGWEAYV